MSIERTRPPDPFDFMPPRPDLVVTSTDLTAGALLPLAHAWNQGGVGGDNLSPALNWQVGPPGTRGFAISCFDPDAPTASGWWHWLVLGLPADCVQVPTGAGTASGAHLPPGAFQIRNDYGTVDYGGGAPPAGDHPHRYIFTVYALDTDDLGVDPGASAAIASATIAHHTLARGHLTVTFVQ